jgi:hypothetical protein
MRSIRHFGFEGWLPRRAAPLTAIGLWVAGFALGGASAWRMQHPITVTDERRETPTSFAAPAPGMSCDNAPTDTPADTAESEDAVLIPEDVIVGRKTPIIGITQMQRQNP